MKTTTRHLRILLPLLALVLLQNCKSYKDPASTEELVDQAIENNFEVPEFWEASNDTAAVSDNWYKNFNDPKLAGLVEEAVDSTNLSIVYQLALIEQNKAMRDLAQSGKRVQIGYGADYAGLSTTTGTDKYGLAVGGGIAWEADLWGRIEAGILSADENLKASIYNYSFTKQSIAATTSKLYFTIGTLNNAIAVGEDFIEVNDRIKEILSVREEVGIIDMKEVYLIGAQIASINNLIQDYNDEVQISTRQLEVVLGRYPENQLQVDWLPQDIAKIDAIGNPFQLIERRPDLKRDESVVRSKFYLSEEARLLKYPNLVLSADIGFSTISDLIFGTGGSFFGPIYTGGAIDAQIESANAEQRQALMTYGLSLLNAFNEVETALGSESFLREQQRFVIDAIDESKHAYELMVEQYKVGKVSLFEVLQTQMQWLRKELDLIAINGELYQRRVDLYLALGGDIN